MTLISNNKPDFLRLLINSLSNSEKNIIPKYLAIFKIKGESNYPLNIFKVYINHPIYNEQRFSKLSKCPSIEIFLVQKSILKYKCLDILSIISLDKKKSKFSEWRKKINHIVFLRTKSQKLWPEAIRISKKVINETNNETASAITLTAIDELSLMYAFMMSKEESSHLPFLTMEQENVLKLNAELELVNYISEILKKYVVSFFVKDLKYLKFIDKIISNDFFQTEIDKIKNEFSRVYFISALVFFSYIQNNSKQHIEYTNKLILTLQTINQNAWFYTNEFLTFFYTIICQALFFQDRYSELSDFIGKYRNSISGNKKNADMNIDHWTRYYQYELEISLNNETKIVESLEKVVDFRKKFLQDIKPKSLQTLSFTLVKGFYLRKNFEQGITLANEIYNVEKRLTILNS